MIPTHGTALWFNVTATLGCGDASSNMTAILSYMRTKNYSSILDAIPASGILNTFAPIVDKTIVFLNYS